MSAEAIIRGQARETLKKNYPAAITALLVVLLPYYIIDGATTVISCIGIKAIADENLATALIYTIGITVMVIGYFLYSPVINGYVRAHYNAAYSGTVELSDVFYYFEKGRYRAALALNIRLFLRMLLPTLLFFLPHILFQIIAQNVDSLYGTVPYNIMTFILASLSTLITMLYAARYLTVMTVSADNDAFSPKQVFDYTKYIMQHKRGSVAKLILSFIPWMLLCLTVLPMLYVIPYMTQSLCISAKWLTKSAFEVR